ncbi:MAG: 30S ribosomal protein S18 [Anaerolineae bacterium]
MADKPAKSSDANVEQGAGQTSAPAQESQPQQPRRGSRPGGGGGGQYRGGGQRSNSGGGDDDRGGKRGGGYFQGRRKVCPVKLEDIDWKNMDSLRYFVSESGSIRSRRKTGATAKIQRRAAAAIKRARHMALLPYTGEHVRLSGSGRR